MVPFSQHPKHTPRGSRVLILTALDSLSSGTEGQDNRRVRAPKTKRKKKEKRQSYPAGFYALLVRGFSNGQQAGFTVGHARQGPLGDISQFGNELPQFQHFSQPPVLGGAVRTWLSQTWQEGHQGCLLVGSF